jgi:hypothetical protein
MRSWRWLIWTLSVGSLTVGCGGPSAPGATTKVALKEQPKAARAAVRKPSAAQKPSLPTVRPRIPEPGPPLPPLTYEPKGRRDPFTAVTLPTDKPGLDVSALKLVGIISGPHLLALVETPSGLGYVLKPGDGLGNGLVAEINARSVTFEVSGQRSPRETNVTLRLGRD